MSSYSHKDIEEKWQKYWNKNQIFYTNLNDKSKPKKYILVMFPYPSGEGLHLGHVRNYTIADVMARYYRLQDHNVFFPIGWDAFGLPAEQYAIQTGNHPAAFTAKNIQRFKEQLIKLGFSFDWSKEINTSEPNYYGWTQWIFKQIYLKGLAEHKEIPVFWCEKLGTVLANEEIKLVNGQRVSERGSYPVVQKSIPQWVLKITNYAEKLLNDLHQVDWPTSIKSLQTKWIGLSEGTLIDFQIVDSLEKVSVFTTRADTIYGVVAVVLSPKHSIINTITLPEQQLKVVNFCNYWKEHINESKKEEIEGVFTGNYCLNPINQEKVPIWIANYVLPEYGTGAVMACPNCHWIDKQFAEKYNLTWKKILCPFPEKQSDGGVSSFTNFYDGEINGNYKYVLSPLIENITNQKEAIEIINNNLAKIGQGEKHKTYHLKDWIFSRQRYWGEPIPIIHWENGEQEILSDEQLPLKLPPLVDFAPSPIYYSPLQKVSDWANVKKANGLAGKRDINVMPQWAGSSWYYLAYLLRNQDTYLVFNSSEAKKIIDYWLPVDLYIGGQEHANLHLLYARFWHKTLKDKGIVNCSEPFQKLFCQGMILGEDGQKMSKSLGNIINPDLLIEKYGVDALRLAIIFLAPPEQTTGFRVDSAKGMKKWLLRVYSLFILQKEKFTKEQKKVDPKLTESYQEMVNKATEYYENLKLNLIPPLLMVFINQAYQAEKIPWIYGEHFLQILNPLAPHLTEEIWNHYSSSPLSDSNWPKEEFLSENLPKKVNIVVMINNKKKAVINVLPNQNEEELLKKIQSDEKINKYLTNQKIQKIIIVKNKIINLLL